MSSIIDSIYVPPVVDSAWSSIASQTATFVGTAALGVAQASIQVGALAVASATVVAQNVFLTAKLGSEISKTVVQVISDEIDSEIKRQAERKVIFEEFKTKASQVDTQYQQYKEKLTTTLTKVNQFFTKEQTAAFLQKSEKANEVSLLEQLINVEALANQYQTKYLKLMEISEHIPEQDLALFVGFHRLFNQKFEGDSLTNIEQRLKEGFQNLTSYFFDHSTAIKKAMGERRFNELSIQVNTTFQDPLPLIFAKEMSQWINTPDMKETKVSYEDQLSRLISEARQLYLSFVNLPSFNQSSKAIEDLMESIQVLTLDNKMPIKEKIAQIRLRRDDLTAIYQRLSKEDRFLLEQKMKFDHLRMQMVALQERLGLPIQPLPFDAKASKHQIQFIEGQIVRLRSIFEKREAQTRSMNLIIETLREYQFDFLTEKGTLLDGIDIRQAYFLDPNGHLLMTTVTDQMITMDMNGLALPGREIDQLAILKAQENFCTIYDTIVVDLNRKGLAVQPPMTRIPPSLATAKAVALPIGISENKIRSLLEKKQSNTEKQKTKSL